MQTTRTSLKYIKSYPMRNKIKEYLFSLYCANKSFGAARIFPESNFWRRVGSILVPILRILANFNLFWTSWGYQQNKCCLPETPTINSGPQGLTKSLPSPRDVNSNFLIGVFFCLLYLGAAVGFQNCCLPATFAKHCFFSFGNFFFLVPGLYGRPTV